MNNPKTVLIDKNPGRNSQTFGIARELGTDVNLIHEPSIGVVGNKGELGWISWGKVDPEFQKQLAAETEELEKIVERKNWKKMKNWVQKVIGEILQV